MTCILWEAHFINLRTIDVCPLHGHVKMFKNVHTTLLTFHLSLTVEKNKEAMNN